MQDRLESILIDIYYTSMNGDWSLIDLTPREKKAIKDYVITKVRRDPIGKSSVYYKLSPSGEVVAEYVIRKYSRDTATGFGGLALERREWLMPQRHNIESKKIIAAFREIASRGKIPIEVHTDWSRKRKRIVLRDLDRALSRISYEVEWELNKHRGEEYLIHLGKFKPTTAWLWCEVLDPNRKVIRSCHFQQEFIVWDR